MMICRQFGFVFVLNSRVNASIISKPHTLWNWLLNTIDCGQNSQCVKECQSSSKNAKNAQNKKTKRKKKQHQPQTLQLISFTNIHVIITCACVLFAIVFLAVLKFGAFIDPNV